MSQMIVPSKKTLIAIAAVSFVVFVVALWRYLGAGAGGTGALVIWALALLVCFESIILIRQAKRPFHMGVYTFALIYAALVVVLHWVRSGLT